jgi:aspartate/methionine/tyrosine aminotransferase
LLLILRELSDKKQEYAASEQGDWFYSGGMRVIIQNLEESKIREVANAGLGREGVLPFWFGESDEVTPEFIRQSAIEALQRGETFYSHNLGLPALRSAIAHYASQLHGAIMWSVSP